MNQSVPSFIQNQPYNNQSQPDYHQNNQQQRPMAQLYQNQTLQQPMEVPNQRTNFLDQAKSSLNNPSPIFIMPQQQQVPQFSTYPYNPFFPPIPPYMIPPPMNYPPTPQSIHTTYLPFPIPVSSPCNMPKQDSNTEYSNRPPAQPIYEPQNTTQYHQSPLNLSGHSCCPRADGVICEKMDCPSVQILRSLISQIIRYHGVIAFAASRILLRRIPGEIVYMSDEQIMSRSDKDLNRMTKEHLLSEIKFSNLISELINVQYNAKPPANVIAVLSMIYLKISLLRVKAERIVGQRIMENQAAGAESDLPLDEQILILKSDAELREMLCCLKQKEMVQRDNLTVARLPLQRSIVENYLYNIRVKIAQVEEEFERRRRESSNCGSTSSNSYCSTYQTPITSFNDWHFDSFEPLLIQIRSPKKLLLRPHVGSPETTYDKPQAQGSKEQEDENKTTNNEPNMTVKVVVLMENEKNVVPEGENSQTDGDKDKKEKEPPSDESKEQCEIEDDKTVNSELVGHKEDCCVTEIEGEINK